jgi:hypothetical protein
MEDLVMELDNLIPDIVPGYTLTVEGRVFTPKGRESKPKPNGKQYCVQLRRFDKGPLKISVLKLLAVAYLGMDPDSTQQVVPKDGNPRNFSLRNIQVGAIWRPAVDIADKAYALFERGKSAKEVMKKLDISEPYAYKLRKQWITLDGSLD